MDTVARAFYELLFENAFLKKKADEFQDFFSTVMEMAHPSDFVRVCPWGSEGDRKSDGYLPSERTLFQVYAPNDMTAARAVSKIDEDFKGALPYWREHFDKWVFVHNSVRGLGPEVTRKLAALNAAYEPEVTQWGQQDLRKRVFQLDMNDLAVLLGPAPSRRDILDLGLEALAPVLDQVAAMPAPGTPDLRPPPADKVKRNMLSSHVETLLIAGMTRADLVRQYFRVQPMKQDEIATTFRKRYEAARAAGLSPDDIFVHLQGQAGGEALPTASRQSAVLAVLAFFFEKCDIFERDPDEGGER